MGLDLSEYLSAFLQDAEDLLQDLDENLLSLEKNPKDQKTINTLFRIAHTLKGSSSMMGFQHIKEYTHSLESVISLLRSGKRELDDGLFEILFNAFGFLRKTVLGLKEGGKEDEQRLIEKTKVLKELMDEWTKSPSPSELASGDDFGPGKRDGEREGTGGDSGIGKAALELGETVRVRAKKLDVLLDYLGELVLKRTRTVELAEQIKGLVGEKNQALISELASSLAEEGRIISSLQEMVMGARMLPIKYLFERCPRIVRGISRKLGKKVLVEVSGSATELDKKMIDALAEPFLHLLSNAVAHGIESPEERKSLGKPLHGLIRISAYHEHNQVVVAVEDDGRGINVEEVREKAKSMGLKTPEKIDKMDPQELFDLLAAPGFSLAEEVTDVSGRGVGVDVVKSKIEDVGGSVEAYSEYGKGARFIIRIPLTLAIIPAVLVRYGGSIFAIPLSFVQEVIRWEEGVQRRIQGKGAIIELRGEVVSIVRLDNVMDFDSVDECPCDYLVIVSSHKHRLAIPVERLLGEREIVMKTLNPLLGVSRVISGASILGNGDIVLILDIFSLFKI